MKTKIIAIDQSTSATKAMLFNDACELLYRVNIPHHQIYPHAGWVEHDAVEIYQNMLKAISCMGHRTKRILRVGRKRHQTY